MPCSASGILGLVPRESRTALVALVVTPKIVLNFFKCAVGVPGAIFIPSSIGRRIVVVVIVFLVVRLAGIHFAPVSVFGSRVDRFAGGFSAESTCDRADSASDYGSNGS